jgi:hypothetical protein
VRLVADLTRLNPELATTTRRRRLHQAFLVSSAALLIIIALRRVMLALALSILTATLLAPELLGLAETFPFLVIVAGRPVAAVGLIVMALVVVVLKRRWWPAGVAVWAVAGVALGYVVISRAIPGPHQRPLAP